MQTIAHRNPAVIQALLAGSAARLNPMSMREMAAKARISHSTLSRASRYHCDACTPARPADRCPHVRDLSNKMLWTLAQRLWPRKEAALWYDWLLREYSKKPGARVVPLTYRELAVARRRLASLKEIG